MIDKTSFQDQGDSLLNAWSALQQADEREDRGESADVEASFARFSDMVNAMMDKGVLGDVIDSLNGRMDSGEIHVPSDMVMDIIDSLSVCIDGDRVWQLVAVPMVGETQRVLEMAQSANWGLAMEQLGIEQGQCELIGVARDTELSLLLLDVVAVGAITRGLEGEGMDKVFISQADTGQFHGAALLRCSAYAHGCDKLGDLLVAEQQHGVDGWAAMLSDRGRIDVLGPRLPREGLSEVAAMRVVGTLEMLRATEPDQARPGISEIMFGFDMDQDLSPDEMCWMGATYRDGTAASIKAMPAALTPMIPAVCALIGLRHGINARPVELADMFAAVGNTEKQIDGSGRGRRLN